MKTVRNYPSDGETFRDLAGFLGIVAGLRSRWRKLHLPTQSEKVRPYGEDKALWFRGQSNAKWGLTPTIWRPEYQDANEAEMRLEFESVGTPLMQPGAVPNKWHWYFLMQHYKTPTRLLDWTLNPLVALYFAVCNEPDQDAAVWVLDPWRWNRAHVKYLFGPAVPGWRETKKYLLDLEEAFDTDTGENQTTEKWPVAIEPPHIDRRIAAQGSKFTLFGLKKDMTESPAVNRPRGGKGKHAILDKIVVRQETVAEFREQLNQIGINGRAMFPDLEGLGKHIAWEWKTRTQSNVSKATSRVRLSRRVAIPPSVQMNK